MTLKDARPSKFQKEGEMELELVEFVQRSLKVVGVRITDENIFMVADWVGTQVVTNRLLYDDRMAIEVAVGSRKVPAFIGDWMTKAYDGSFMRYKHEKFLEVFQESGGNKYKVVLDLQRYKDEKFKAMLEKERENKREIVLGLLAEFSEELTKVSKADYGEPFERVAPDFACRIVDLFP